MNKDASEVARKSLKNNILRRQASLTECEAAFLHGLLVDDPLFESDNVSDVAVKQAENISRAAKVLDDDILFSLPFDQKQITVPPRTTRSQANIIGLWRAHEEGVPPSALVEKHSSLLAEKASSGAVNGDYEAKQSKSECEEGGDQRERLQSSDAVSIKSDEEIRVEKDETDNDDEHSSASSWDLSEGGFDHYDAWAVLKDEYAGDFGFDYSEKNMNDELDNPSHTFLILGTSADDTSAQPHVLSPPLMESLLSFVPESVCNENLWLRFSLVRDGASLATMKRYVRAAPYTILAIETTKGEVFGSFTTSPWSTHLGYYGSGRNNFLWKMRHNRLTPCHSLFEQAQMETEIDVYCYSGLNTFIQVCRNDRLALGGGTLDTSGAEEHGDVSMFPVTLDEDENCGFGLAIDDDLLKGTTSPCATFRNPSLVHQGETFEIVNLEVWSFTPCRSINDAQKLELGKFYIHESIVSNASSRSTRSGRNFSSQEMNQEEFYRRVGQRDESEVEREGWQYAIMMNPGGSVSGMHSPNING